MNEVTTVNKGEEDGNGNGREEREREKKERRKNRKKEKRECFSMFDSVADGDESINMITDDAIDQDHSTR